MSAGFFYRSRIIQSQFNIPQIQGGQIGGFNPVYRLSVSLTMSLPSINAADVQSVFTAADSISPPQHSIPVPTISVLVTSP